MMARRVVRYWEKWGGQEERAMRGIVSAFNESQDRFLAEMEQAGDWSSSPDLPRFLAAQSSGNTPDVIGLEDHQVVDLAQEDVLVPLARYSGDIFLPAFERLGTVEGTPYGVPVSANVRAYEWVAHLAGRARSLCGDLFSASVNPIGRLDPDPFMSGKVAMVVEGDWLVRQLIRHPDLEWVPAPLPSLSGRPQALVVADVLCIPRGAKNPDGAQAFIDFASETLNIETLAIGQNKISPLRVWSRSFIERHPNPQIERFSDILSTCALVSDPRVPGWLGYLERIKSAFEDIWSGHRTPAEALASMRAFG